MSTTVDPTPPVKPMTSRQAVTPTRGKYKDKKDANVRLVHSDRVDRIRKIFQQIRDRRAGGRPSLFPPRLRSTWWTRS